MRDTSVIARAFNALRDGSFLIRVGNRISTIKYVPAPEPDTDIDRYIAAHYRGNNWGSMSEGGKHAWVQFSPIFEKCKIDTIVYVGANDGTKPLGIYEAFPGRSFYLLEPQPQVFEELARNVAGRPNITCINIAAGDKEGWFEMFIDDFSPASSLLPYDPLALKEFPFLGNQRRVQVRVKSLDSILEESKVESVDLLLMDVQGFEDHVLQGARRTLNSCQVIISELSLQELYIGSSTFDSVYQVLVREGFRLQYLFDEVRGQSRQILQIDGVFFRA